MGHAYRYMLLVTIYVREVFENLVIKIWGE